MKASSSEHFSVVQNTDEAIMRAKQTSADRPLKSTVALWLDLSTATAIESAAPLVLQEVKTEEQWQSMFKLRLVIEAAFGITDAGKVNSMIEEIKLCQQKLNGRWFLAKNIGNGPYIGEIGIVKFTFNGIDVGRVQDVDIIPGHQKTGLGIRLLSSIIKIARESDLKAICLKADQNDWPLQWYKRLGFKPVGEWLS